MGPGLGRRWGSRVFGAVMPIGAPDDNGHDVRIRPCETPPAEKQLREFPTAGPDGATYPRCVSGRSDWRGLGLSCGFWSASYGV